MADTEKNTNKDNAIPVEKRVRIKILATQDGDNSDVFLGVNGFTMMIRRGEEVAIPQSFIDVLNNSVIDTTTQETREDGTKFSRCVQIQRYPYIMV